jgi:hypothetical protein
MRWDIISHRYLTEKSTLRYLLIVITKVKTLGYPNGHYGYGTLYLQEYPILYAMQCSC